jgi:hypothetical protein
MVQAREHVLGTLIVNPDYYVTAVAEISHAERRAGYLR